MRSSSMNATELFVDMLGEVRRNYQRRTCSDASSPMRQPTVEAPIGTTYKLRSVVHNLVACRAVDARWAIANVLHFFAATEEGAVLLRYNRAAARFVSADGTLQGAYGPIAVPQMERCAALLQNHPDSRRAVVSMGELPEECCVNSPACWSMLHFISGSGGLDMVVYQRSLNLFGVMPYDCVLLCNILNYMAWRVGMEPGSVHWTVGSLHCTEEAVTNHVDACGVRLRGILLEPATLADSKLCAALLLEPSMLAGDAGRILAHHEEVRL